MLASPGEAQRDYSNTSLTFYAVMDHLEVTVALARQKNILVILV